MQCPGLVGSLSPIHLQDEPRIRAYTHTYIDVSEAKEGVCVLLSQDVCWLFG